MLRALQTIQLKSFVLATAIYVALQLAIWLHIPEASLDFGILAKPINALNTLPFVAFLVKNCIVIVSALLLANTVIRNDVIYKHTALPYFFFLLISTLIPSNAYLSSFSLLSLITVLIFNQIVHFHDSDAPSYLVFKASILVGIGSMIHLSFAPLILVVIFSYTRFLPLKFRPITLLILGALFPWVILWVSGYTNPDLIDIVHIQPFPISRIALDITSMIIISVYFVIIVAAAFIWVDNSGRNTVKSRRLIQIVAMLLFILSALAIYLLTGTLHSIELVCLPGSLTLAYFFCSSQKMRLRNTLLFILIAVQVVSHYKELLSF